MHYIPRQRYTPNARTELIKLTYRTSFNVEIDSLAPSRHSLSLSPLNHSRRHVTANCNRHWIVSGNVKYPH
jgi:hypothetical protein